MSNTYRETFKIIREKKIKDLYNFILRFTIDHHYGPLYSEMASSLMCSTSTIKPILDVLFDKGLIESDHPGSPRAIRINFNKSYNSVLKGQYHFNEKGLILEDEESRSQNT